MAKNNENIATIHERMAVCVKLFGEGKNTVFADKLGVSEGNIRGYIKGVVPKADVLEKIVRTYDVSPKWLLTGEGEINQIKTEKNSDPSEISSSISFDPSIGSPFYDVDFIGGFDEIFNSQTADRLATSLCRDSRKHHSGATSQDTPWSQRYATAISLPSMSAPSRTYSTEKSTPSYSTPSAPSRSCAKEPRRMSCAMSPSIPISTTRSSPSPASSASSKSWAPSPSSFNLLYFQIPI